MQPSLIGQIVGLNLSILCTRHLFNGASGGEGWFVRLPFALMTLAKKSILFVE